jgi:hypothetical protein
MTPSRDDVETTSPGVWAQCPTCGSRFRRVRRQRYCCPACKQAAWRARRRPLAPPDTTLAAPARRRDVTVYTCPDCEERYLGQQWCYECNRPCTRTGIGGLCPACEHPIAVEELLPQQESDRPVGQDRLSPGFHQPGHQVGWTRAWR